MEKKNLFFAYIMLIVPFYQCYGRIRKIKNKEKKEHMQTNKKKTSLQKNQFQQYALRLDGVECPLCEQVAINHIKSIAGVSDAWYKKGTQGYEDGSILVSWNNKHSVLTRSDIEKVIEQEEFIIIDLQQIHI